MKRRRTPLPGLSDNDDGADLARRRFLRKAGVAVAASGAAAATPAWGGSTLSDAFASFFQDNYRRMTRDEIDAALERIERKAMRRYGVEIRCKNTPPIPGVVFGYALNISKCRGYRDCVHACVQENNISRDNQYIRVVEMDEGSWDLRHGDHYYAADQVPREGKYYLPMQCMQCDNPPCVKACPIQATWMEDDGIVVVDYDWCFGCRYCMAACPYQARHFNWGAPVLPPEEINPDTHYLGNRPRPKGVVEKCHFCVQRTRQGRQPACQEACPTGARIFGNLLDPDSEIRYVLEHKTVFRLKEDLGTEPKFWYFRDD
jgi:molybdopterin-containing oxidoreductase family iron-sulfur binding subunit